MSAKIATGNKSAGEWGVRETLNNEKKTQRSIFYVKRKDIDGRPHGTNGGTSAVNKRQEGRVPWSLGLTAWELSSSEQPFRRLAIPHQNGRGLKIVVIFTGIFSSTNQ